MGMKRDGFRILERLETCDCNSAHCREMLGRGTNDKVRVDERYSDSFILQLGTKSLRESRDEGLATRIDGK